MMFAAIEVTAVVMAALGVAFQTVDEKKATSSQKKQKDSDDLSSSELKYPKDEEGE